MYRQLLKTSLARYELSEKNRNSPKDLLFCNGLCQDFRPESSFSLHKNLCKDCRNLTELAMKQIADSKITIEQFKENPQIVNGVENNIETEQQCKNCKEVKNISNFDPLRRICKACRTIQAINRNNKDLDTHISDIEKLKTNINELQKFINHMPKDKLIRIISHFNVGRKSSDTKERMVYNTVEHFKKLLNPNICLGGCGFILEKQFSECKKCKRVEEKK